MTVINGPFADTRDMPKVHMMFRREFGLLPALIREVAPGNEARSRIVADHIEFLCGVLEHHHRGEDDSLWPRLSERGTHEVAQVALLMEGQHEQIERVASEIQATLGDWRASAAADQRDALGEAVDRLVSLLDEHMGMEEKRILPMVEKYVTAAEWEEMVRRAASTVRPEDILLIAGMIMYESGPDFGPPDRREALRKLAPQAYAAYSKRVHGTPTPPRITG